MKIIVKYDKEEKLEDFEIKATDFYLATRQLKVVKDKKSKKLFEIPEVTSISTNGGNFREIQKEIRQALLELDSIQSDGGSK